jgi:hypothetical protein
MKRRNLQQNVDKIEKNIKIPHYIRHYGKKKDRQGVIVSTLLKKDV